MTPAFCSVKHDPENGKHGDCLRACVASVLDIETDDVPHFYSDTLDGAIGIARVRTFLASRGYGLFAVAYAAVPVADLMSLMETNAPTSYYILCGGTDEGADHACVYQGGKMVHDPGWIRTPIIRPGSEGHWSVLVISK